MPKMDAPNTRRESKKDQREKGKYNGKYSTKHVRKIETSTYK